MKLVHGNRAYNIEKQTKIHKTKLYFKKINGFLEIIFVAICPCYYNTQQIIVEQHCAVKNYFVCDV